MRKRKPLTAAISACFLGLAGLAGATGAAAEGGLVERRSDDPAILAAYDRAQETLPRFLELAETPPPDWSSPSLKVAFEGTNRVENIWIVAFAAVDEDRFTGQLANDPVNLPGLAYGDTVRFGAEQIIDWSFIRGGRAYGHYTTRELLGDLPEKDAAAVRAFLSDRPLPEGWED